MTDTASDFSLDTASLLASREAHEGGRAHRTGAEAATGLVHGLFGFAPSRIPLAEHQLVQAMLAPNAGQITTCSYTAIVLSV